MADKNAELLERIDFCAWLVVQWFENLFINPVFRQASDGPMTEPCGNVRARSPDQGDSVT